MLIPFHNGPHNHNVILRPLREVALVFVCLVGPRKAGVQPNPDLACMFLPERVSRSLELELRV